MKILIYFQLKKMNKLTLRFLSEEQEQRFQQQYNVQTLYPLSMLIFIGGAINAIFKIITQATIYKNSLQMSIWIIVCIYYIAIQFVITKNKLITQKLITLTILVMNASIIFSFPSLDQQNLFVSTFNITTINTISIMICDFKHSLILVASILSIWTTYVSINYQVIYLALPITFFNVMTVTMVVSYWNCRQFRQKYLLGEQENLWVNLIQNVCDNPFQILTFDNINLKYKIENENNFQNQDFIKVTQFENKPLQTYIYQTQTSLVASNGLLKDETIMVNQKKQNYKIRITYYYIQKIFIIVQLLQDENKIDFLRQNNHQIDRKVQEMIQQIVKMLPSAVKSTKNLLKLKLALMEVYFRRFKIEIKQFNLNKLISKHIKPFNKYRQQIQFEYERIINMSGYQSLYSLIFMRILYSTSKIGLIRLSEDEKGYHVIFYGEIILQQDQIIQNCLKIMKIDMEIQRRFIKLTQTDIEYNDQDDFICENSSHLINP
ncbi:hypothetical protein pb186bvf_016910 [Paramecium bursaria]